MNCSVYSSSFLPYRNPSSSNHLSSFRIDDILKPTASIVPTTPPTSSSSSSSSSSSIDAATAWSSFAAQLLAYSPELLSSSTMNIPNSISPPIPNLISPVKQHHRHQYHPYLSSTNRHSPTGKLQHDSTSMLTLSTNKNNYQHTLSPLAMKDKLQHQHIDRKDCLSSLVVPSVSHHLATTTAPPPPSSSSSAAAAAVAAAYWPYLYSRCHPSTTGGPTNSTANPVSRRKGGQIRFSAEQSLQLEKKFEISQYLSPIERKQIAKSLQLSERQIKTWFQNRRAKHRRSAATVTKKDLDKSGSSPRHTDDEDDEEDDDENDDHINIEDNADEEHATSSSSN